MKNFQKLSEIYQVKIKFFLRNQISPIFMFELVDSRKVENKLKEEITWHLQIIMTEKTEKIVISKINFGKTEQVHLSFLQDRT